MSDFFSPRPVRLFILLTIVAASVAGGCYPTLYTPTAGNAGSGMIFSPGAAPAYNGRDTTVTSISASGGSGLRFNYEDHSIMGNIYLQRGWTRKTYSINAGGGAYHGTYSLAANNYSQGIVLPAKELGYTGAHGFGQFTLHSRSETLELRHVSFALGILGEWGALRNYQLDNPNRFYDHRSSGPIVQARLTTGLSTIPQRPMAAVFGLDGGFLVTNGNLRLDAQASLGAGPLSIFVRQLGLGSYSTPPIRLWGLQVRIPPFRHR